MNTATTAIRLDDRDWSQLTLGERIYQLEVEGYLVLPDLLPPAQIAQLKQETGQLNTFGLDYSVKQQVKPKVQFVGGAITDLIAHAPTISFLRELFGDEIVFMAYAYARSEPGHPGISLHTDGQPYGSQIFGYEGSCPFLVRVLYYLDDLTPEISPFRRRAAFASLVSCRCQSLQTLCRPPRRGDGHGQGRLGCADQPQSLSRQFPECGR